MVFYFYTSKFDVMWPFWKKPSEQVIRAKHDHDESLFRRTGGIWKKDEKGDHVNILEK